MALALAGCSSGPSLDPVDWWHDLEGGKIAEDRPPPPNADAPYRALGDAPQDKPAPTDPKIRDQIAEGLVADRAHAQYAAALDPLAPPAPVKPAPPVTAAAAADASSASLAAASAPPPAAPKPAANPTPAPPTPVESAMLPPPATPPPQAPSASADAAAANTPLPTVPDAPPPPAALPGVAATTVSTPPPVPPPPKPPAPAPLVVGAPVTVPFATGSSALPNWALPGLKLLAQTRKGGQIAITGFGDAHAPDPSAQAEAMPLALARARAVAANLLGYGVPSDALRISAEAQGAGAVARLVN